MKLDFTPVDYDYFDFQGKNYILMFGRSNSKKICVVDEYLPSFWVILEKDLNKSEIKKIQEKIETLSVEKGGRESSVEKVELHKKNFLGEEYSALKVFVTNHKDMHEVADQIGFKGVFKRREYDLGLITKYIADKKIKPFETYECEVSEISVDEFGGIANGLDVERCVLLESFKEKKSVEFKPKVLAYDIETSEYELGKGDVLMISLYGENLKKVFTWKKCSDKQSFVYEFSDEADMLDAFVQEVKKQDPDILAGYFSDGFDLPYLKARASKNKIPFALGVDGKGPVFTRGQIPSGKITGIVHVDVFRFISSVYSQYLQSETLSLNDVALELLGEEKEDFDFSHLKHMNEKHWKEFFSYNIQDSKLTYDLFWKIWPDMMEFSKIIQEPLFTITRNRMATNVEDYIVHNLEKFNEIAEKRPGHPEISSRKSMEKYEGAFVFKPTPGLYENLAMFDFTSMYSSVIITYNLSKSTFLDKNTKDSQEIQLGKEKVYFSKKEGFFPKMLGEILEMRKKYKAEYKNDKTPISLARSNAYKLLANAAYGYQGFFGARYYCREAAAATAAMARENIHLAISNIEKRGYKILYSDTDSIAFLLGEKNKTDVKKMLHEINDELPGIMELDLEDFYKRGLFVSTRSGKGGAKKKYALIDEENNLKIRGFETVRRDWCRLARRLQSEILELILKEGNEKKSLEILKKTIGDLKSRKIDLKDLIIKTQLKKEINEYLSEGPHVAAAKKMEDAGVPVRPGMVIEYYIAEGGKKGALIRDKIKLIDEPGKYEIEYYLENQILPAVENIFEVFGINVKEFSDGKKQTSLSSF